LEIPVESVIQLGLRYEYNGPYTEASDRIANLTWRLVLHRLRPCCLARGPSTNISRVARPAGPQQFRAAHRDCLETAEANGGQDGHGTTTNLAQYEP